MCLARPSGPRHSLLQEGWKKARAIAGSEASWHVTEQALLWACISWLYYITPREDLRKPLMLVLCCGHTTFRVPWGRLALAIEWKGMVKRTCNVVTGGAYQMSMAH